MLGRLLPLNVNEIIYFCTYIYAMNPAGNNDIPIAGIWGLEEMWIDFDHFQMRIVC